MGLDLPKKLAIFLSLSIAGCSSLNNPVLQTVNRVTGINSSQQGSHFDPHFKFLRVVIDGRVVYPALGNIDNGTEVWYSATREVLRIKDGRIVGTSGMFFEWRNVVLPEFPSWSVLAKSDLPFSWMRMRDVMPGYRYGIEDHLVLRRIAAPGNSQLAGIAPEKLVWFEEDDISSADALPPARYAYDPAKRKIVYGETCLAPTFCFSWQRWPEGSQ